MPQIVFDITREASHYIIEGIPFGGINFWVAMYPAHFAKWTIQMECRKAEDTKRLVKLAGEIITLGSQEKVYRLMHIKGLSFVDKDEDIYYMSYLKGSIRKNKQLPFF